MRISKKGLYALEAMIRLARNYPEPTKISNIAAAEDIPQKLLELILLHLKMARFVRQPPRRARMVFVAETAPRHIPRRDNPCY